MANEINSLEKVYEEALKEVQTMQFGGIDQASEEYLELVAKRYALAELKKEISIMKLEENTDSEEVSIIKAKMVDLEFEKAQNYYEEGCYRWALAQLEKASPNSMVNRVPDGLVTELFEKLMPMGVVLAVKEGSANAKQAVKALMLQRSSNNVSLNKEVSALEVALENINTKKVR